MKRSGVLVAALLGGVLLTGCPSRNRNEADNSRPQRIRVDREALAAQIRTLEARRVEDWASRDVERIASHYAPGASVILPCQPRVIGAARIRARIANMIGDSHLQLRFDPDRVQVAASGDLAYSVGTYVIRGIHPASGQRGLEIGNYLTVYRHQRDGSWMVVDDVAVPGGPPSF
ncbi:MAG TPA: DUF4440 domain-containing protein [Allosphingosinicella sp.]|jgi:ketosteroid isomerase-like protein